MVDFAFSYSYSKVFILSSSVFMRFFSKERCGEAKKLESLATSKTGGVLVTSKTSGFCGSF